MNAEIDVREILPTIAVPTLVLHRSDEYFSEGTRYVGTRIPGARARRAAGQRPPAVGGRPGRRCSTRSSASSPASATRSRPTACSRPSSSPTSSARPRRPPSSATVRWRELLARVPRGRPRPARALPRPRGRQRQATGCSRRSTAPPAPCAARRRSRRPSASLGVEVRAGVHTGEIEQAGGEAHGIAVHIAARIMRRAGAGRGARLEHGQGHRRRLRASRSRSAASGRCAACRARGACSPPRREGDCRLAGSSDARADEVPVPATPPRAERRGFPRPRPLRAPSSSPRRARL